MEALWLHAILQTVTVTFLIDSDPRNSFSLWALDSLTLSRHVIMCLGVSTAACESCLTLITFIPCLLPSAPRIAEAALNHERSTVSTCGTKGPCDLFTAEPPPPGHKPKCPAIFRLVWTGTPPPGVR